MIECLVSKHVRLIQDRINREREVPDRHVVGSWEEWHALREELFRMNRNMQRGEHVKSADCGVVNFLLCGVPCVAEPVPLVWDGNHILIESRS